MIYTDIVSLLIFYLPEYARCITSRLLISASLEYQIGRDFRGIISGTYSGMTVLYIQIVNARANRDSLDRVLVLKQDTTTFFETLLYLFRQKIFGIYNDAINFFGQTLLLFLANSSTYCKCISNTVKWT